MLRVWTVGSAIPSRRPRAVSVAAQNLSSLRCPPEGHGDLVQRVVGPHQHLRLHGGAIALALGGEGDPAGEHVALRRHQRERLGVGVQYEDAGGQLDPAPDGPVKQGDVARVDAGERAGEPVALGPELGEVLAPGGDRLLRLDPRPGVHPVGLLPHLAEALHRAGEPALVVLGRYREALAEFETAAAIASGGEDDPAALAAIEHKLADVHHRLGDWDLAEAHLAVVTELVTGADPGRMARAEADRAVVAYRRGAADRAAELGRELGDQHRGGAAYQPGRPAARGWPARCRHDPPQGGSQAVRLGRRGRRAAPGDLDSGRVVAGWPTILPGYKLRVRITTTT